MKAHEVTGGVRSEFLGNISQGRCPTLTSPKRHTRSGSRATEIARNSAHGRSSSAAPLHLAGRDYVIQKKRTHPREAGARETSRQVSAGRRREPTAASLRAITVHHPTLPESSWLCPGSRGGRRVSVVTGPHSSPRSRSCPRNWYSLCPDACTVHAPGASARSAQQVWMPARGSDGEMRSRRR
jgi:hypothetical protein